MTALAVPPCPECGRPRVQDRHGTKATCGAAECIRARVRRGQATRVARAQARKRAQLRWRCHECGWLHAVAPLACSCGALGPIPADQEVA